jgi:L-histidine Nalpha-methyltransferase
MSMPVSASFKTTETVLSNLSGLGRHVRWGLMRPGQKQLGPEYLYDEVGSALFEAITYLPEYGLTRADERLLSRRADQIAARAGWPALVVEMGSGSGRKIARLLSTVRSRREELRYFAVDVSESALIRCEQELGSICDVTPIRARFLEGVRQALAQRERGQSALLLLVGSTIGNFDRAEADAFLSAVRGELSPGDQLLIGADLVKDEQSLLLAYDDPAGVTAAFNRNILCRINRELGANFDLRLWKHVARYDPAERRVEMHLEALQRQSVSIPGAACSVRFQQGETIWTESSYKYTTECLDAMARSAGFAPLECWIDAEWPFAECIWKAS